MDLIRPQTCRSCKHVRLDAANLTCHAHPPQAQAILVQTPEGPRPAGTVAYWPLVQEGEDCGEWRPRIERAP